MNEETDVGGGLMMIEDEQRNEKECGQKKVVLREGNQQS